MNELFAPYTNQETLLEDYVAAKTALLEHSLYIAELVVGGVVINEVTKARFRNLKTSVSLAWDAYQADEARYHSKEVK